MLQIDNKFKEAVVAGLLQQRENFTGSDEAFAKQYDINKAIFSRLKKGEIDKVLKEASWLNIGIKLNITIKKRKLKTVKTEVLKSIEEEVAFCQENSKARMFVDDSEIGKTVAARYLAMTRQNCFYVDCSQARTAQLLIRLIAKTIGIESTGRFNDVKEKTKYYLNLLPNPCVLLDDGGLLKMDAFPELHEMWNATEYNCGWFMIGDDSLQHAIEKGIRSKKQGVRAFFSRWSSSYSRVTPEVKSEKLLFYRKLIIDVLTPNINDTANLNSIVAKCIRNNDSGHIGGLRRAESILILNS